MTMPQTARAKPFVSPDLIRLSPRSQPVSLSDRSGLGSRRMNAYLLRHYQQVSEETGGGRGFVSFVPIVVTRTVPSSESGYEKVDKENNSDLR